MRNNNYNKAIFHLPGLFEFYKLYEIFLPLYEEHREYFYEWCEIGSIYGSPQDCIWSGGRTSDGEYIPQEVLKLLNKYNISPRLTFSNSLLKEEHLEDKRCNELTQQFEKQSKLPVGIIIHSDKLLDYLKKKYPDLYFVSSTTKVITDFQLFKKEIEQEDFKYVVPDFRLNKNFKELNTLTQNEKDKVEFLCNECCWTGCNDRKKCYENVSQKNLNQNSPDHICKAPYSNEGYKFSRAKQNPSFISIEEIKNKYIPAGYTNFKIEGRGLGTAINLEFLLYYLTKPQYQLQVREAIYLDSMLDLF